MEAFKLGSVLSCDGRREDMSFVNLQEIRHLWLSAKQSSERRWVVWASYPRVEPGKGCCSHSRFQWSERLAAGAKAWMPADVLFSKASDKGLLSAMALLPIYGLEYYLSCSFLHLLCSDSFSRGGSVVWFSLQCQAPPGNSRVHSRGQSIPPCQAGSLELC